MRLAACMLLLVAASAQGSDAGLYQHLESSEFMSAKFVAKRTATGIDFESKEKLSKGERVHPRFHIEVEGALPIRDVTSLEAAIERVAAVVSPEVDRKHPEKNMISPGLGVDVVDVNGVNVAFLQYKSSREPDTFIRRAVIYTKGGVYVAAMSLHSVPENDRMGMFLVTLIIEMINSNEIPGLRT